MSNDTYTLNIFDEDQESSWDCVENASVYYSLEEAIETAREALAPYLNDTDPFIQATVFLDTDCEPVAVYCLSNKNRIDTAYLRQRAGYSSIEVDEYLK